MKTTRRRIAIGAVGAVLIATAGLVALDRALPGIVVKAVSAASGRQLTIGGDFDVNLLTWPPRVHAEQVSFANAPWGTEPTMFDARAVEFTIEPLALLRGEVVAPEVILSSPEVVLERSPDGRRNWTLSPDASGDGTGPRIGRLVVNEGSLTYRDRAANTELFAGIATHPAANTDAETRFSVNGRWRGVPVSASGTGGEVLALRDTTAPFPIRARFRLADVRGTIDGTVSGLASLDAIDVALTLSGKDLAGLAPWVKVPPDLPSFDVAGRLAHRERQWSLTGFDAHLGESQLAGQLHIDLGGKVPSFDGKLTSKRIDADLLHRLSAPAHLGAPDDGGWAARLRGAEGRLQFAVERVRDAPLPIDGVAGTLKLHRGVATIDALSLGVAGGKITSSVRVDAAQGPAATQVSARLENLALERLFPSSSLAQGIGGVGGQVKLAGRGDSLPAWLASADGSAQFVVTGGQIDARLIQALRLDATDILRLAFGSRSSVQINCAVADFKVDNGTMNTQAFVIDTPNTTVAISGSIDVADRTLDLLLKPFSTGVRLFSAPVPVHIAGSFAKPSISVDNSLFLRGGAALLLGLINPLAAVLPLINLGDARGGQCAKLLARAQAPVPSK